MPAPSLVIVVGGRSTTADPTRPLVIGRAQAEGVAVEDPRVSHRHVVLWFDGVWRLRNEGRNGTFLDGLKIDELTLTGRVQLTLAEPTGPQVTLVVGAAQHPTQHPTHHPPQHPSAQAWQALPAHPAQPAAMTNVLPPVEGAVGGHATGVHQIAGTGLTIGRAPDNALIVDDLLVSRHHARLTFDGRTWVITDLDSSNGTYVDGRRISSEAIHPASIIGIGHHTYRLADGRLIEYRDDGAVTFEARNLGVVRDGRRILDDVSFVLEPNSMLVIVGPSGSGKSTLLTALTGTRPADEGQVGYGGRDLYSNYDEIRHRIGFVPQDDILHPQLRVAQALDYAGRLRFPPDVDAGQRAQRVQQVIGELGLVPQSEQRISTLSGGQRKRTSTAMELLTRPSLLFLDEPTSGLDINRDREVMTVLRTLADGGRTVVVVSHNVAYLGLADRILVLATGGQLAFYGPPAQALTYFGFTDYADMYAALEQPRNDWRQRFEASPLGASAAAAPRTPIAGRSAAPTSLHSMRNQTAGAQFATLCRRYLSVIAADRAFLILTVALPFVLALFAHTVPGAQGLSVSYGMTHDGSHSPGQLLLVLIIGGCLMGGAASVREIVKERPIFERERAIGLSWTAYLASKVVVLGVITGVQATLLALLGVAGDPGPDDGLLGSGTFDVLVAIIGVTIASMVLSLILSVVVSNADRVMPLLVLVIMAQLLMSGGLFPVKGSPVLAQLSWLSPSRWGFAAGASVVDLNRTKQPGSDDLDPLWKHVGGIEFADLFMLVVLTALYLLITAAVLSRIGQLRTRTPAPPVGAYPPGPPAHGSAQQYGSQQQGSRPDRPPYG